MNYTYDDSGNVTKIADTPTGGGYRDVQCFDYDRYQRVTEAWAISGDDCNQAPSNAALGGPAPYWQSYSYSTSGLRTNLVDHGTTAGDVSTSYSYVDASNAPDAGQPHTLAATTTTDNTGTHSDAYTYDNAGNTKSRPGANGTQTLNWDAEGHLQSVTDTAGSVSYLYDADGNRLISRDTTGKTLYLPGEELRFTNSTGLQSCTRYYSYAGGTVAQRTAAGLTWLASDHQGTRDVTIDAVACGAAAGAIANMVQYSVETAVEHKGNFSLGGMLIQGAVGAVVGGVMAGLGSIGGQALKAGASSLMASVGERLAVKAATPALEKEAGTVAGGLAKNALSKTESRAARGAANCVTHSFAPSTGVLTATGSIKAIKDVKVGDKVTATDPLTGKRFARKVLAVHLNHDTALTDLRLKVNGHDAVLHTTQHHPFWDETQKMWVNAGDLMIGAKLHAADGVVTTVLEVANIEAARSMYDLTIDVTHTYAVVAGDTTVLVHNCNFVDPSDLTPVHGISGDASTKNVARIGNDMRAGNFDWEQSPISVARHEGTTYVLDGHHRLAAAKWVGLDRVGIRDVTDELANGGFKGYKGMADVLDTASRYTGN